MASLTKDRPPTRIVRTKSHEIRQTGGAIKIRYPNGAISHDHRTVVEMLLFEILWTLRGGNQKRRKI